MMCLPRAGEQDRAVIETEAVQANGDWWTGLVHDRDTETGERRFRLERWVANGDSVQNPHTWRVRPDFWATERTAIQLLEDGHGTTNADDVPVSSRYTTHAALPIRRDESRRVAAVRVETDTGERLRLYHWDTGTDAVRQKFTTGKHWDELVELAEGAIETLHTA